MWIDEGSGFVKRVVQVERTVGMLRGRLHHKSPVVVRLALMVQVKPFTIFYFIFYRAIIVCQFNRQQDQQSVCQNAKLFYENMKGSLAR